MAKVFIYDRSVMEPLWHLAEQRHSAMLQINRTSTNLWRPENLRLEIRSKKSIISHGDSKHEFEFEHGFIVATVPFEITAYLS